MPQYSSQTLQWIAQQKDTIQQVADKLGVSATSIAAAMAKERTLWEASPTFNSLQDTVVPWLTDAEIRSDYAMVKTWGLNNTEPNDYLDPIKKGIFSTLNDLGYANIKQA